MKMDTVDHIVDLEALPELTDRERAELILLRSLSDDDIDQSDIPALTEEAWRRAVSTTVFRRIDTSTAVRLDDDVLAWFKAQGTEYEARINAVLRRAMMDATMTDQG